MKLRQYLLIFALFNVVLPLFGEGLIDKLFDAVRKGDKGEIEHLLAQGAEINVESSHDGNTPLALALDLGQGSNDVAELLFRRGGAISAQKSKDVTALFCAAAIGNLSMVQRLIASGVNVNESSGSGKTPLYFAIKSGSLEVVKALLDAGASVKVPLDEGGEPYVLNAAERGDFDTVNLLLQRGADVNQSNDYGCTALMCAAEKNLPKLVLLLLNKGAIINAVHQTRDGGEHNALCCAAAAGAAPSVRLLMARGLDPAWGEGAAIREARAAGHEDVVALLERKSEVPPISKINDMADVATFPPITGPLVVALSAFTTTDNSWKSAQTAASFSALLQTHLNDLSGVQWVERDNIQKAEDELRLQASGLSHPTSALQFGKWLNAQLLVTGRFSADEGDGSRLIIEVLDLQRADVLARRSTVIKMPLEKRFAFDSASVPSVASLVSSALAEAARELETAKKQVLVAPLFFRNASNASDRLDYLGDDIALAFSKSGSAALRIVRFPHAERAGEESELVLSGLVEANPEAWKRVADYYVWGDYEEVESSGIAFDQVQVRLKLHVWDGASEAKEQTTTCLVGELQEKIPQFIRRVLGSFGNKTSKTPDDTVRESLAGSLHQRMREIQSQDTDFSEASRRTAGWLHRWQIRLQLLELAHFLAPNDGSIHCDLILERWNHAAVFYGSRDDWHPSQFGAMWRRSEDWRNHVDRFGFSHLEAWPRDTVSQTKMPEDIFVSGLGTPMQNYFVGLPTQIEQYLEYRVGGYPDEVPQGIHQRWCRQLSEEFVRRLIQVEQKSPDKFVASAYPYFLHLQEIERIHDASQRAKAAVALWKLTTHREPVSNENVLKHKRLIEASLRAAGREGEAAPLFATYAGPAAQDAAAPQPSVNSNTSEKREKWKQTMKEHEEQQLEGTTLLPGEVRASFTPISLGKEYLIGGGLDELAFINGLLVVGAHTQIEPSLRQCSVIWRYHPMEKRVEAIPSLELKDSQTYSAFVALENSLWMTSQGSGVSQFEPQSGKVAKFTAREGLPTEDMLACATGDGAIFCGGGQYKQKWHLATFDLKSRKWASISKTSPDVLEEIKGLAFSKHQLLVMEDTENAGLIFSLFDTEKRTWSTIPGDIKNRLGSAVSGGYGIGLEAVCMGDNEGFWIGGGSQLLFHNPNSQNTEELFASGPALDGVITCMKDDGELLWVATTTLESQERFQSLVSSRVYLIQKNTRSLVGFFRVPYNGPVTCIAASPEKLWLGVDTRYDSEVYLVELEKSPLVKAHIATRGPAAK